DAGNTHGARPARDHQSIVGPAAGVIATARLDSNSSVTVHHSCRSVPAVGVERDVSGPSSDAAPGNARRPLVPPPDRDAPMLMQDRLLHAFDNLVGPHMTSL